MGLKGIHAWIKASKYKPWQIYFLGFSLFALLGLHLRIGLFVSMLYGIEGLISGLDWLVIMGIQGVLIGFVAEAVYEQGDGYAKVVSNEFGSKDRTLVGRLLMMTVVSGIITKVVPSLLRGADFVVLRAAGALLALGILLVHQSSSDWNWETEWPAIVAGVLLAVAPSLT